MSERRATIRLKGFTQEVTGTHLVTDAVGVGIRRDYIDSLQVKRSGTNWVFYPWHMVIELRRPWEDVSDNISP